MGSGLFTQGGQGRVPWEHKAGRPHPAPNLEPSLMWRLEEHGWGWQDKAGWVGQDGDLGQPLVPRLGGCPRPWAFQEQGVGAGGEMRAGWGGSASCALSREPS